MNDHDHIQILGLSPDKAQGIKDALTRKLATRTPELEPYAWPGGYPVSYWNEETDNFCGRCATKRAAQGETFPQSGIDWEGPATCTDCGVDLAAYPEEVE